MLLATFWFSMMNLTVKQLSHLPAMELVFFRCGIASLLGLFALHRLKIPLKGNNKKLLLLRGITGTLALFFFLYTLQRMSLGTAVTIQYLSPVFTALLAIYILKEPLKPVQFLLFALAFAGVLLMKGFESGLSWQLLSIGVLSSLLSAVSYNLIRVLKEQEHPLVVVLHFQLLGTVAGFFYILVGWVSPQGVDWIYLFLLGLFTQWGQVNMTRSLQIEKAARVTIVNFLGIPLALVFGVLLFNEGYGPGTLAGMGLVALGVLINLLISRKPDQAEKV